MVIGVEWKLAGLMVLLLIAIVAAVLGLTVAFGSLHLAAMTTIAIGILGIPLLARWIARPLHRVHRALSAAAASCRDGDFNSVLVVDRKDELGQLLAAQNELVRAVAEQHFSVVQRELMLDTITQNSPVALVLVDFRRIVVVCNIAARHMFDEGRSLVGRDFHTVLQRVPEPLRAAVAGTGDGLVSVELEGIEETFHISQRAFQLQGQPHRLYLFKRLTRELSRQEVATWKKLIRVLSHELNNSLAPIVSFAQSGAEAARRGEVERLAAVFAAIVERAHHLHDFISQYAALARLPTPRPECVDWRGFVDELTRQHACRIVQPLPATPGWFDRSQLHQALINLIKNAREAGASAEEIELCIVEAGGEQRVEVRDRGPGMTAPVLAQALLPFYSTKRGGTGIGLALTREIAEAHGGRVSLANRADGGLIVSLTLPSAHGAKDPEHTPATAQDSATE